jgi:hypothetical protein
VSWIHYYAFGGFTYYQKGSKYHLAMSIILTQASTSVNNLIAISGYFGITSRFNARRLLMLYLSIVFYTRFGWFHTSGILGKKLRLTRNSAYYFPLSFREYRFHTRYVAMSLIAPVLSEGARNLGKTAYRNLFFVLFGMAVLSSSYIKLLDSPTGCTVPFIVILYLICGYFRLHGWGFGKILACVFWLGCYRFHWEFLFTERPQKLVDKYFPNFFVLRNSVFNDMASVPFGDYRVLSVIMLTLANIILFREVVSISGPLGNCFCFLGRYCCAIYTLSNGLGRANPFHFMLSYKGFERPEDNCFWNHIRFSFSESIGCVTFEIFRDFFFVLGMSGFDTIIVFLNKLRQLFGRVRSHHIPFGLSTASLRTVVMKEFSRRRGFMSIVEGKG